MIEDLEDLFPSPHHFSALASDVYLALEELESMTSIQLTVEKASPNDSGRGIARLAPAVFDELRLSRNEFVTIAGEGTTAVKARHADDEDWNNSVIRIDRFTRKNAGICLGEHITLHKTSTDVADRVDLAPIDEIQTTLTPNIVRFVKQQLLHQPIVQNDLVPVSTRTDQPFLRSSGDTLSLVAVDVSPNDVVKITVNTDINVRDVPVSDEVQEGTRDHTFNHLL